MRKQSRVCRTQGGGPVTYYFFRLLCDTLRELWRLFDTADNDEAVTRVMSNMPSEAKESYAELRELFVRPEASEQEPEEPRSWAERHLKDVRDRTFHYPHIGSAEFQRRCAPAVASKPG
jgi:hypothetical protein